jgi:hypothetical protein
LGRENPEKTRDEGRALNEHQCNIQNAEAAKATQKPQKEYQEGETSSGCSSAVSA